jgi:RimJ/RimL family protein N-acetyltransferase
MRHGILRLYEDYGYGPYRVSLKDSGDAIGICGLFRRDGLDDPDIGYATLPEYCGKGYASEAGRAVVEHARTALGLERVIAIISPENAASIGLIGKLGFEFERMHRMPDDDHDICIYGKSLNKHG